MYTATQSSSFAKVVDFRDRVSDAGIYRRNSPQNPNSLSAIGLGQTGADGSFPLNVPIRLTLTGNRSDNFFTAYINGVQDFRAEDPLNDFVFSSADNVIRLFQDDMAFTGEDGTGKVSQFRIYSGALTASEVAALGGRPLFLKHPALPFYRWEPS